MGVGFPGVVSDHQVFSGPNMEMTSGMEPSLIRYQERIVLHIAQ